MPDIVGAVVLAEREAALSGDLMHLGGVMLDALADILVIVDDAVARAITDGLAFEAFSCEYILNILEARSRALPEPGPLQLTRRHDLLEIDIDPPDLNAYEVDHG